MIHATPAQKLALKATESARPEMRPLMRRCVMPGQDSSTLARMAETRSFDRTCQLKCAPAILNATFLRITWVLAWGDSCKTFVAHEAPPRLQCNSVAIWDLAQVAKIMRPHYRGLPWDSVHRVKIPSNLPHMRDFPHFQTWRSIHPPPAMIPALMETRNAK